MKALGAAIVIAGFIFASLAGWRAYTRPDTFVVGGSYTVHRGDVVTGDVDGLFSQITVEEGAQVKGNIRSISSVLDLAGEVDGSILLVGCDVVVRSSAQILQPPRQVGTIPYVILLPRLARTGSAALPAQ